MKERKSVVRTCPMLYNSFCGISLGCNLEKLLFVLKSVLE
jgi:hypothetical protein